jgi:feruloyl esterase
MTTGVLTFCNVSVTYSHPGYNDAVNTHVLLPFADKWNERLMGLGGGGFTAAAPPPAQLAAVNDGFAAVTTDGGHSPDPTEVFLAEWAVLSPGNNNLPLIEDFATTSVADTSPIGKAIATAFYGRAPKKAYWTGCSQGGRQGHMLAQRYPDAYDGIMGIAPAINWAQFFPSMIWPQAIMNFIGYHPPPCELAAITVAAMEECDPLDGVVDGVISRLDRCHFNASTMVGKDITCDATGQLITKDSVNANSTGYKVKVTEEAAKIMNLWYKGPTSAKGEFQWYGLTPGSPVAVAGNTTCELVDASGKSSSPFNCSAAPLQLGENWIRQFAYAVPNHPENFNTSVPPWSLSLNVTTREDWDEIFHLSLVTFNNWLQTDSKNLDRFRELGGKLLTWHGTIDQYIVPNGTVDYYDRVTARDKTLNVETYDYYRFFEAPGIEHCYGGDGPFPGKSLDALIAWVEQGQAPETLEAITVADEAGLTWERPLCLYPKKQVWSGKGDSRKPDGWTCE